MQTQQYFQSFHNISKIKNAKSLSFQCTEKNATFNIELLKEFKLILQYENIFRILFHSKIEDNLHDMVIALNKESLIYPHKHEKEETYHIIIGKMLLVYFTEKGEIDNTVLLSNNDILIARVDKETYHAIIVIEDAIYHETRVGPFITKTDSTYPDWCKNKDIFMKNIVNEVLK